MNKPLELPINDAKAIAERRGWDQVIVIGRRVADDGYEHVVTYGKDKAHCEAAARAGMAVKHHLMRWPVSLWDSVLRLIGTGRDAENPRAMNLIFSEEISDHDIRMVHDMLKPETHAPDAVARGA